MTRLAQLSHNYRRSPLATAAPPNTRRSIAAGDRLPSVPGLLRDGKPVSTLDLIGSPTHTLPILTGTRADPGVATEAIARLARWRRIVQTIVISPQDRATSTRSQIRTAPRTAATTPTTSGSCWCAPTATSHAPRR